MLLSAWPLRAHSKHQSKPAKGKPEQAFPQEQRPTLKHSIAPYKLTNPKIKLRLKRAWVQQLLTTPEPEQQHSRDGKLPDELHTHSRSTAADSAEQQHTLTITQQEQEETLLPVHKRRRLFSNTGLANQRWGSPRLRTTFIPKVAACAHWRPRLANRIIPKFLPSLDGPCTAFLLRHLATLQPARHLALKRAVKGERCAVQRHVKLYLQQPVPGPGPWPPPEIYTATYRLILNKQGKASQQRIGRQMAERAAFEQLVAAICTASKPKLHTFSGGALAACAAALGEMHAVQLPANFWQAWELATLPLLNQLASQLSGCVTQTSSQPTSKPAANLGRTFVQESGDDAQRPAHESGVRKGLRPVHLGWMLSGVGRCQHMPSTDWQQAFKDAASAAAAASLFTVPELGVLLEGYALVCLTNVQHKPGANSSRGVWMVVEEDRKLLQLLCLTAAKQQQPATATLSPRFALAPLLAAAAYMITHLPSTSLTQMLHSKRASTALTTDVSWVYSTMQWWCKSTQRLLHVPAAGKLASRKGAFIDSTSLSVQMSPCPALQPPHILAALWSLAVLFNAPSSISLEQTGGKGHGLLLRDAEKWIQPAAAFVIRDTPERTAYHVYIILMVLGVVKISKPHSALLIQCQDAVADSVSALTWRQIVDCLRVLAAWHGCHQACSDSYVLPVPTPSWMCGLAIKLQNEGKHATRTQLLSVLNYLSALHLELPPICATNVLSLLHNPPC